MFREEEEARPCMADLRAIYGRGRPSMATEPAQFIGFRSGVLSRPWMRPTCLLQIWSSFVDEQGKDETLVHGHPSCAAFRHVTRSRTDVASG
ncbi:hypothetical protein NL676_031013 [Syzygium grande]|nr:hypothetical protein NL676_031013 [Syzygium grande]